MSLIIKIYVNETKIQSYVARNTTLKDRGWNTYEVSEWSDGHGCILGTIRHKYEDGAAILARKALKFATKKVK